MRPQLDNLWHFVLKGRTPCCVMTLLYLLYGKFTHGGWRPPRGRHRSPGMDIRISTTIGRGQEQVEGGGEQKVGLAGATQVLGGHGW